MFQEIVLESTIKLDDLGICFFFPLSDVRWNKTMQQYQIAKYMYWKYANLIFGATMYRLDQYTLTCVWYGTMISNWRGHFQNLLNPLLMKIEILTLYRIGLELVTEWNLDLDNWRKYIFFFYLNFVFP